MPLAQIRQDWRAGPYTQNRNLLIRPHAQCALSAPDVGFVALDGLSASAERARISWRHGLTKPVHHEPSRFVGDAQHTVHLVGADAFL